MATPNLKPQIDSQFLPFQHRLLSLHMFLISISQDSVKYYALGRSFAGRDEHIWIRLRDGMKKQN